jgi:PTH1 family peptidyl-tRNA hydrolase
MKVIVGLGNPGIKYRYNRHNVGFMVLDALSKKTSAIFYRKLRLPAQVAKVTIEDKAIILVKPLTFMNSSGLCVKKVLDAYKAARQDLLVVYDDADLDLGVLRLKKSGSSAGQQGMAAIIDALETDNFARLRIGISKPQGLDKNLADYVLCDFPKNEMPVIEDTIGKAVYASIDWVIFGSEYVMKNYNV